MTREIQDFPDADGKPKALPLKKKKLIALCYLAERRLGEKRYYLTSPKDGKVSYIGFAQRLIFIGPYRAADTEVFPINQAAADPHTIFYFMEFSGEHAILPARGKGTEF